MIGIIPPSDRFIPILTRYDDTYGPTSNESVNSSITTHTPLILQRLRHWNNGRKSQNIDKLNFEALGLHGRDQELDIMNKSLDRLSSGVVERQLILISGDSGAGKTSLAHSLETPTAKLNGLFARGKFDFHNRDDPYSGIVRACVEICDHILILQEQDLTRFQQLSQLLKDGLGSEISLLIKFIPALTGVIDFQDEDPTLVVVGSSSNEARNRFRFAFQRFIRIISNSFAPLVLVLDDLQWADVSSLDLLFICLSDPRIKNVMVIGTFRSSEVDETHILSEAITRFRTKCGEAEFEMTSISIENLDINDVNNIIAKMLYVGDASRTMDLAKVCFKKTKGNPFFVIQFLQLVRNSGQLHYNDESLSWEWNCDEIDSSTSATSNVVDLLKEKIAFLPNHLLEILKIAAALGSTFIEKCLRIIWENSSNLLSSEESDDSVRSSQQAQDSDVLTLGLEYLEQDGYIVRGGGESSILSSQSYSWTHDKIQEAAMMLIPMEQQASFRYKAGDILLSNLSADELEAAIFIVANLVNAGKAPTENEEKRLLIARLNHDASMRALSIAAFESVAGYAAKGIKLLPDNHWNEHYELSLGLYSAAAQAEGFLGNTDLMEQYCSIVLSQKERPMIDKMWVYQTLANSMMTKGQVEEAANLLFSVLAIFKCRFPRNPVSIAAGLIKTAVKIKSLMKKLNPQSLEKLSDPMIVHLVQLLSKLIICLYLKKDARLPLVTFRILDWTVKHGHCDHSSVAFAWTAFFLVGFLHDLKGATWYGEHALKLMEKCNTSAPRSRTTPLGILNFFVFMWTKPVAPLLQGLLDSYNESMQAGDQDSAAYSVYFWLSLRYVAGDPLGVLVDDFRLYSKQMKDWKMKLQLDFTNCVYQVILNLMGRYSENSTKLIGDAMTEEDYRRCCKDDDTAVALMPWEGILLTYFGDHVRHAVTAIKHGPNSLQKRYPASPFAAFDTFLRGVSCFAAAGETGESKYAKMGNKLRLKVRKWREMGNPNVVHYESFLDAEFAVLKNKRYDAVSYYQLAISRAERFGFTQDAAFASERLGDFQLTVMGDEKEAAYRIGQSIEYWREWGAMAKVEFLEEKYGHLSRGPLSQSTIVIATIPENKDEVDSVVS